MKQTMLDILIKLIHGPTVKDEVFRELKLTDKRQFNRDVATLGINGFIHVRKYFNFDRRRFKGPQITILVLKPRGADHVCNELSVLERDFVRTSVPQSQHIRHDMHIASVIRRITTEAKSGTLVIESMQDEAAIKQEFSFKNKSLKGLCLPDLKLTIRKENTVMDICVEVDAGGKGMSYWVKKLKSLNDARDAPIVITIALNPERLEKLMDYLLKEKVYGKCFFIPFNDFIKIGLKPVLDFIAENPKLVLYNYVTKRYLYYK